MCSAPSFRVFSYRAFLQAARPKTLLLAVAVILAGNAQVGSVLFSFGHLLMLWLTLLLAAAFQILSNFANDYGDFVKGTDAHRQDRMLAAGQITPAQMKAVVMGLSLFSLLFSLIVVWVAYCMNGISVGVACLVFVLGVLSVAAALGYTLGKRPYGYYALGDLMVFVFFGGVGVLASFVLQGGHLAHQPALYALALCMGAMAVTVLNMNNMRDSEKDKRTHKITLANLLGARVIYYQIALFVLVFIGALVFLWLQTTPWFALCAALLLAWRLRGFILKIQQAVDYAAFNHLLFLTARETLVYALVATVVGLCR